MVSVCVQTFQHVGFIRQCLDGILMQKTNFDFEILLGDDFSTDGTREISIEYAEKHPEKIRLFLHKRINNISINGSPSGRFNFLYNLFSVRGKYVAICEGDDFWTDPTKLQRQVDFLETNPSVAGCFHDATTVDGNGTVLKNVYFESPQTLYDQRDCITKYGGAYATCAIVFRSSVVKVLPDWFINSASDYTLDILITEIGKIAYLPYTMSSYRIHSGGIWQGSNAIRNLEVLLIRYNALLSNRKFKNEFGEFLNQHISKFSRTVSLSYRDKHEWAKELKYAWQFFFHLEKRNVQNFKFLVRALLAPMRNLKPKGFKKILI